MLLNNNWCLGVQAWINAATCAWSCAINPSLKNTHTLQRPSKGHKWCFKLHTWRWIDTYLFQLLRTRAHDAAATAPRLGPPCSWLGPWAPTLLRARLAGVPRGSLPASLSSITLWAVLAWTLSGRRLMVTGGGLFRGGRRAVGLRYGRDFSRGVHPCTRQPLQQLLLLLQLLFLLFLLQLLLLLQLV